VVPKRRVKKSFLAVLIVISLLIAAGVSVHDLFVHRDPDARYYEKKIKVKGGIRFVDSRRKQWKGKTVDEKRVGHWVFWYPNGRKQMEGDYSAGAMVGKWSFWRADGRSVDLISVFPRVGEDPLEGIQLRDEKDALWITTFTDRGPSGFEAREYVLREVDKEPILFYTHYRGAGGVLSPSGKKVVVLDQPATKSCVLYVADLVTGKCRQVDEEATRMYHDEVDTHGFIVVSDYGGVSPDEDRILVKMHLDYITQSDSNYKPWSYVVDVNTGKVLQVIREANPPAEWWKM